MKEYKVMLLSIKDGKWYNRRHAGIYTKKDDAIIIAETCMDADSTREYPNFSAYKIMERTVSEWKEVK